MRKICGVGGPRALIPLWSNKKQINKHRNLSEFEIFNAKSKQQSTGKNCQDIPLDVGDQKG